MDAPVKTLLKLVRTSQSPAEFASKLVLYGSWPVLRPLASAYRATLARKVCVVAVVGSLGKTSTTRLLIQAFADHPPAHIQRNAYASLAKAMLKILPWQHHSVIEVGISKPGIMGTYARLVRPDIVVVTSIASEHHRSFHTLETTRQEKADMVRALPKSGFAVLNGDDANVLWMKGETQAQTLTYGFGNRCDVRAREVLLDWPNGTTFRIEVKGQTYQARTRLLGRTMVYPALAAAAVASITGMAMPDVLKAIAEAPPVKGRLHPVRLDCGAYILGDEFKSTLETIDAALDLLEEIPARRKFVIMGAISEPPKPQGPVYKRLGARIASVADRVVIVGGKREFQSYRSGALNAGMDRQDIFLVKESPLASLDYLPDDLGEGDVVLIKGRDRQRLERISMALTGHKIGCTLPYCQRRASIRCYNCARLLEGR